MLCLFRILKEMIILAKLLSAETVRPLEVDIDIPLNERMYASVIKGNRNRKYLTRSYG